MMSRLTAVLRSMNLYAELSSENSTKWRCHFFGRCKLEQEIWLEAKAINMSNAEVTVTFEDREQILSAADTQQWKRDNPFGAIWVDFSQKAREPHRVQITINLPSDVHERVKTTDLSREDVIVTVGCDDLTPRGESCANAFLSMATVHFHTRYGQDGLFGREF